MDITFACVPVKLDGDTELRPIFDSVLRTFSVQLWQNSQPAGIHGLVEQYPYADEAVEEIDDFLEDCGVRGLTEAEQAQLFVSLTAAKGGPDLELLKLSLGQAATQEVVFDGGEAARLAAKYIEPTATVLPITYGATRITTADGVHLLITDCEAGLYAVHGFRCDAAKTAAECDDPEHTAAPYGEGEEASVDLSEPDYTLDQAASALARAAAGVLRALRQSRR